MCFSPSVGTDHTRCPGFHLYPHLHLLSPIPLPPKALEPTPPLLPTIQNHRRPPAFFATAFPRPSTSFHFPGLCSSSEVSTSHPAIHLPRCPWDLTPASHTTSLPMALQTLTSSSKSGGLYSDPEAPPSTSALSSPSCLCQPVSARLNLPYESKISGENCIYTERHYFPCH